MSAVGFGDELVRDYLLYRGFLSALKTFDSEVKVDKDRGFRPDRIVEHLSSCIINMDLNSLRESWAHLDQRFFSRLEHSFLGTAKKLETALLRMYLVTCISSNRQDKLLEFFEKMTTDLQGQPEWKDWLALPFMKNIDEHPTFSVFFTRQWQDTMLLSLHNFISVVFQSAAMPTILCYEEELNKLQQLTEENDLLRKKLAAIQAGENVEIPKSFRDSETHVYTPSELMDDFYVIAQEAPPENTGRSIKSLIRNISGGGNPTSPVMTRRPTETRKSDESSSSLKSSKTKPRSPSVPPHSSASLSVYDTSRPKKDSCETFRSVSTEETSRGKSEKTLSKPRTMSASSTVPTVQTIKDETMSGFIILSREKYSEHNSLITHCKFNCSGNLVASSDLDGVIKIWNAIPSISTVSTIMSKTSVLSLEWDRKRERLLLYGGTTGIVRIYDTKERRVVKEITGGSNSQRVLCIGCNPLGSNFVTSTSEGEGGQLCLWDMKTLSLERNLSMTNKSCAYCCSFNHNGQLLLIGSSNGTSSILDLRTSENIATWPSHNGAVLSTEFCADETSCYTMGTDKKFFSWSVNKTGHQLSDLGVQMEGTIVALPELEKRNSFGKLFCFNSDGSNVLTCGPLGGIIYKVTNSTATPVLDIGGHNKPVNTVDWLAAMESSTCICGTVDGKVIVSTLLNQ